MPARNLPVRPSLAQLKFQAQELKRLHRQASPAAAARISTHHPAFQNRSAEEILARPFKLADAQLVIAREYGQRDWARLKHRAEISDQVAEFQPHPRFEEAVAAMDVGDIERLRSLLARYPELILARTNLEPPFHYFTGATLLHHVAGNPDRGRHSGELGPIPKNIAEVARLLLESGAEVEAKTLGPNGGSTLGLLLTSAQASLANVSGVLIDVLLEHGAKLDVKKPDCLKGPLSNHAPRAAEKMIELGAKPDLFAFAALGRLEDVKASFDAQGKLRTRQRSEGKALTERDAIGLALLVAYVQKKSDIVDFLLEKDGNWNMVGVNNGTAMHRAANDGDLGMVKRLVVKGADVGNRGNPFVATPLSWADHFGQTEVVEWMRQSCVIDIHDAVCFNFPEQVAARLRESPRSINERRDQWSIPQATPLHCAALTKNVEFVDLLIKSGAEVNLLAGNGQTALDIAENEESQDVAKRLLESGGKRAAEL